MTTKPKVSVIVPIYKAEKYLPECLDSLLCQTLRELEILLVDDGSPDACPEICEEYARRDERIRVIHKENGGLLRARITGVAAATADYIGFLDDDDRAAPEMFETLHRAAVAHEAQMVCSSYWRWQEDGYKEKVRWDFPAGFFAGERLKAEFYPHWFENRKEGALGLIKSMWSKLFDRRLLASVYADMPQEVTLFEDMIVTFAVAARAERMVTLPDTALCDYRVVQGSMQHSYWRNYYQNMTDVIDSLQRMPCRPEAAPFRAAGVAQARAYALYDILYNECKPERTSTGKERRAIIHALMSQADWQEAARLDVLPKDSQTSRLFQRLLLARQPGPLRAALEMATLKNRLLARIKA